MSRRERKIRHALPSWTHRIIGSRESTRGERALGGWIVKTASSPDSAPSIYTILPPCVFNYSVIFSRRREVDRLDSILEKRKLRHDSCRSTLPSLLRVQWAGDRCVEGSHCNFLTFIPTLVRSFR